jgi:hypothetical protein
MSPDMIECVQVLTRLADFNVEAPRVLRGSFKHNLDLGSTDSIGIADTGRHLDP